MTWAELSAWFCRLYGAGLKQEATVAAWIADVFRPAGITPAEARAAVVSLAAAGGSTFPADVLARVPGAGREARAAVLALQLANEREGCEVGRGEACRDCHDSGWAIVPRDVASPARTCAVSCSCAAGLRLAFDCRQRKGHPPPCTLASYESDDRSSGWREAMARHRREKAAEGLIETATTEWGRLVDRQVQKVRRA